MKKVLLIVAMLLSVAPVMATTTVTATSGSPVQTPDGNYMATVTISYSSDVNIRAFALDINIDSDGNRPNFQNIRNFKTGESNGNMAGGTSGYGIFPSRFRDFIVVTGPNWVDPNYNPTTAWNEPGTTDHTWGMGFPRMIVEMGTLFAGDANKPPLSGTLFKFDVNNWGATGTRCITVAADALRGGVVNTDGNTITASYVGTCINFPSNCTTPLPEVGNPRATAEAAWTGQEFSLCGTSTVACPAGNIMSQETACLTLPHCLVYTYGVAPAEPNVRGSSRAAAVSSLTALGFVIGSDVNVPPTTTYPTLRTVLDQNPTAGTTGCGTTVHLSVVSYPIKDTAFGSMMANWITNGRPQCWAYPKQCRGDADGKKAGANWVSSADLTVLMGVVNTNKLGSCADFTHSKAGANWVTSADLAVLMKYVNAGAPPDCCTPGSFAADPNFWYFCMPTGGTYCPPGTVCAPAAVCPNTP